jgi:hypothetical protein
MDIGPMHGLSQDQLVRVDRLRIHSVSPIHTSRLEQKHEKTQLTILKLCSL